MIIKPKTQKNWTNLKSCVKICSGQGTPRTGQEDAGEAILLCIHLLQDRHGLDRMYTVTQEQLQRLTNMDARRKVEISAHIFIETTNKLRN